MDRWDIREIFLTRGSIKCEEAKCIIAGDRER